MAEAPFKITDRRGSEQYRNAIAFTEPVARRYDGQRRYVEDSNDDASRLVTRYSREALVSMGRYLYQNASPVRSALNQMAELGAMGIQQQFDGLDVAWGKQAEVANVIIVFITINFKHNHLLRHRTMHLFPVVTGKAYPFVISVFNFIVGCLTNL